MDFLNNENITYIMPLFSIAICIILYAIFSKRTIIRQSYLFSFAIMLIVIGVCFMLGNRTYMLLFNPVIFIIVIMLIYPIFLKMYIKARNIYLKITTYKDLDTLNREIEFKYNPSIIGYLINQRLELKDLSADIMNLYAKKIIKIEKDKNFKYKVEYGENYNKYKKNLSYADKYILWNLLKTEKEFEFIKWEKRIKEEYDNLELSKEKEYMNDNKFFITNGLIVVLWMIALKLAGFTTMEGFLGAFLLALGFTFFYVIAYHSKDNKRLKLTSKGKKEIKKCIKLKKFMQEYTLLDERTMEEIQIYEKYIPYAIVLGINSKYFSTVSDIFGKEEIQSIMEYINITKYYGRTTLEKN